VNALPDGVSGVLRAHRGAILASVALLLATMLAGIALLGLSGGFLTAAALTFGVVGGFNFFSPSAGIRALTLARIVSRYAERLVGHEATLRIARDLRVWFFARLLALSPGQLARLRTGDLLARLGSDIDAADGLLVRALGPLLALLATGVAVVAFVAWQYPPAGVLLCALAIVVGVGVPWQVARGRSNDERARAVLRSDLRATLHEACDGAADLAGLAATQAWLARVPPLADALAGRELARRRRVVDGQALHALAGAFGLVAMLWLVSAAVADDGLPPAMAAAVCFATLGLLDTWAGAGLAWQSLLAARASIERIDAIAAQAPRLSDPAAPQAPAAIGALRFEQVVFGWEAGRPVLDGATLEIAPGERVAVRGDSGIGKSTLAALALRSVDPDAGAVRWAGVDLRALAQADWQARVAWLPQEAPVFAGTLGDNLRLGAPKAADARLWDVLACVRLDDWARAAGGLAAWIGEAGATVSAGQARRIALARALLREGPLVLLDEPGEGLDEDTARAVLGALPRWLAGRSLLLITHGPLPAGVVDRELVLKGGRFEPA